MELHIVIGAPLVGRDPASLTPESIKVEGLFSTYDAALDAWRAAAQRTIDDAEMRFVILRLDVATAPNTAHREAA
ncbi:DUF4170 domain-containing protein [Sphingomonas molluscorum]|uniref:DUF4170 domain-containing protein n=1 Tax=Sphingomonas molluscorum TaxID=418184 RepID=UPI0031D08EAE